MSTKKNLKDTLLDGLEQLIKEGSNKDLWFSTRAIADSIIALNFCLPSTEFNKLKNSAADYMLNQCEESLNDSLNWNEEIWDTSIAAISLTFEPVKYSNRIIKASRWIKSKYLKTHTSWNEEIWETLLALNSISYLHQNVPLTYDPDYDFTGAIEWLLKIVDTPKKGLLINWSSTALLVLLAHSPALSSITRDLELKLKEASEKCEKAILEAPILESDELLWTPEAWSNGLVLWALSVAKSGIFSEEKNFKIVKWFRERIAEKDLPTEDRAFSCIGIYKYLEFIEVRSLISDAKNKNDNIPVEFEDLKEKLQDRIALSLKQRVSDFQFTPPFFSRTSFSGYYSVNIKIIIINVGLILAFTVFVSYLTWTTQIDENKKVSWLVLIPIVLGSLATIAQLANFTLIPKRKKNKTNSHILNEDE